MKDKRYIGKSTSWIELDEMGMTVFDDVPKRWKIHKEYIAGCDPYKDDCVP